MSWTRRVLVALAVGLLAAVVHGLLPAGVVRAVVHDAATWLLVAALGVRIWRAPVDRRAWSWIVPSGFALLAAGNVMWDVLLRGGPDPTGGVAEGLFLVGYALTAVGLRGVASGHVRGGWGDIRLESVAVGAMAGALVWVWGGPAAIAAGEAAGGVVASGLVALSVIRAWSLVRIADVHRLSWRLTVAALAMLLWLVTDVVHAATAAGTYTTGGWPDTVWFVATVLLILGLGGRTVPRTETPAAASDEPVTLARRAALGGTVGLIPMVVLLGSGAAGRELAVLIAATAVVGLTVVLNGERLPVWAARAHRGRDEADARSLRLFEEASWATLLIDPEGGGIVDANPAAADLYGYSISTLRSMRISEINTLSPADVAAEMARARQQTRTSFEFRHRLADGTVIPVDVYSGPTTVGGRQLLVSIVHDATDRHRALDLEAMVATRTVELELALRRSQASEQAAARLARVVESAGEAIIGLDLDGTIISWNPAAEALYGYCAEDAVGQPITLLTDPEYAAEPLMLLQRVGGGESVVGHLTVRRARDGRTRQVQISLTPILGPGGKVVGAAALDLDVTRLQTAERAAGHAVEMFETIFRSGAPQGVTDLDGQFIEANDALCELLGYSRELLLGMRVGEITDATDREETRRYMAAFRGGSAEGMQLRKCFVRRDGHIITVLANLTLLRDADGEPEAVIGLLQDVSAQAEAEQQLSQREALLQGVLSSTANVSSVYDTVGRCLFAAGAGLEVIGETPDSMVGSYFVERHGDSTEMMDGFRRAVAGASVDVVRPFRGRVFDVRFRPVVRSGASGHVALAVTDITDREHARQAVERSERRFRALVQHANDAILQTDPRGVVLAAGAGVERLVGLAPDEVVGNSVLDFVVPEDWEQVVADLASLSRGAVTRATVAVRHASGEIRQVEYDAVDLRDDDAVGSLVVTLHDVTERVRADRERDRHAGELQVVNQELEEALRVRDHILAATTHELRTPLTPMVGLIELMRARWDDLDREDLWRYFEVLRRNTDRLTSLVEDLLFATGLRSGVVMAAPEAVPVGPAVRKALGRFPETVDTPVVEVEVSAWCTPDHLNQILTALVANAVKYGLPTYGASIDVGLRTVTVSISDRGEGVPDDVVETMFEPFSQGSTGDTRTATRLGLGLPIARALAESNGGALEHRPGPQGGSIFVLTLPTVPASAAAEPGLIPEVSA